MIRFLKILARFLTVWIILMVGLTAGWLGRSLWLAREQPEVMHTGLTIERLAEISHLLTLKVEVADVLVCRIRGWTGGVEAGLLVKGDVHLGVDLSQARLEDVSDSGRSATLILPGPTALARLDHEKTAFAWISPWGTWAITPGHRAHRLITGRAMRQAQDLVASAAQDRDTDQRARRQAEAVLTAFCRSLGWEVRVRWVDR